jgi:hypothetical protein
LPIIQYFMTPPSSDKTAHLQYRRKPSFACTDAVSNNYKSNTHNLQLFIRF